MIRAEVLHALRSRSTFASRRDSDMARVIADQRRYIEFLEAELLPHLAHVAGEQEALSL